MSWRSVEIVHFCKRLPSFVLPPGVISILREQPFPKWSVKFVCTLIRYEICLQTWIFFFFKPLSMVEFFSLCFAIFEKTTPKPSGNFLIFQKSHFPGGWLLNWGRKELSEFEEGGGGPTLEQREQAGEWVAGDEIERVGRGRIMQRLMSLRKEQSFSSSRGHWSVLSRRATWSD